MTITILTAARDAAATLPDCLRSVAAQKLPEGLLVHHRVLDGGSTDGSIQLLESWAAAGLPRSFRSERDGGFYEALNRAIRETDSEIVGILNADDFYFDDQVLARVAEAFEDRSISGVYGDLVYVDASSSLEDWRVRRYWRAGRYRPSSFRWGWMPPHPTVFVREAVYESFGGFRLDFGSSADYEWLLRVMAKGATPFHYLPRILVAMRQGGMSNRSTAARLAAHRNDRRAWTVNGMRPLPWTSFLKPLRKIPQWIARPPVAAEEN